MRHVDFLVIGQGLAGSVLSHQLLKTGKSVFIIDETSGATASRQATGLINPITGRRFVKSWLTDELQLFAETYYAQLENELASQFFKKTKVIKVLQSIEQQNDFGLRLNDDEYAKYLEPSIVKYETGFFNTYGCAHISPAFKIDVNSLQQAFLKKFEAQQIIKQAAFKHTQLQILQDGFQYEDLHIANLIFAEGYLLRNNPFFSYLPIKFAKGEVLIIECPNLHLTEVLNANINITPLGANKYYVGATYDWNDDVLTPSQAKKAYLVNGLNETISVPYTILDHKVGIRPTVVDRRPLIGEHPKHKNMYVFNGMGTKGLSLAPYFAHQLISFILEGKEIHKEANINRVS